MLKPGHALHVQSGQDIHRPDAPIHAKCVWMFSQLTVVHLLDPQFLISVMFKHCSSSIDQGCVNKVALEAAAYFYLF